MMQSQNLPPEKAAVESQFLPVESGDARAKTVTEASRHTIDGLLNYQATAEDLSSFRTSVDELYDSDLIDSAALKGLRVMTFDSKYLYVLTQGGHVSTKEAVVEEIPLEGENPHGFRLFKIKYEMGEKDGQPKKSYGGAYASFYSGSLVPTVTDHENLSANPWDDGYKGQLAFKIIHTAPQSQFDRIHRGYFDYKTDVMFHEAGHIEEYAVRNWETDQSLPFPTQKGVDEFCDVLRRTSRVPKAAIDLVLEEFGRKTVSELYAMTVDREARRKLRPESLSASASQDDIRSNIEVLCKSAEAVAPNSDTAADDILKSSHAKGAILAYALEEVIPDYKERKKWLQELVSAA